MAQDDEPREPAPSPGTSSQPPSVAPGASGDGAAPPGREAAAADEANEFGAADEPDEPDEDDAPDARVDEARRLGSRVGPYRLERQLGRGGMGVVYEAVHVEIGQRVAIKLLSAHLLRKKNYRARFLREAKAGSRVRHPGLVQIFDYGVLDDSTPFIQMEFMAGELLRAYLTRQPGGQLSTSESLRIGRQVATALAAAHDRGVVHRDLKPDNVMLVPDAEIEGGRRARVLDFGIAKLLRAPSAQTLEARGPLGTPTYMSPEQCRSDADIGTRSDVYSLGAMLYELLTGRPPFVSEAGDPMRVVFQHIYADPRPPRALRADIPEPVERLLLRMLAKDASLRPEMTAVADELTVLTAHVSAVPARRGMRAALRVGMPLLALLVLLFELVYRIVTGSFWPHAGPRVVRIHGKEFRMGSTDAQARAAWEYARTKKLCEDCEIELYLRETPQRLVTVSDFELDATEVTNQDYAAWLQRQSGLLIEPAPAYGHAVSARDGILLLKLVDPTRHGSPKEDPPGLAYAGGRIRALADKAQLPVANVTWEGAQRYCQQQGKRLPTEAEWEFAARGPQGRSFPWGESEPGCSGAVFNWSLSAMQCDTPRRGPLPAGSTLPDRTPDGVFDLGGNVAEWVFDGFRDRYTPCASPAACRDPRGPGSEDAALPHVIRGGSWALGIDATRSAGRSWEKEGAIAMSDIGFRCAKSVR